MTKRFIQDVGDARQRPRNKADTELVAPDTHQFLLEIRLAAKNPRVAPANDPEPAGARYRGSQTSTGY